MHSVRSARRQECTMSEVHGIKNAYLSRNRSLLRKEIEQCSIMQLLPQVGTGVCQVFLFLIFIFFHNINYVQSGKQEANNPLHDQGLMQS